MFVRLVTLVAMLAVAFAGCGSDDDESSSSGQATAAATATASAPAPATEAATPDAGEDQGEAGESEQERGHEEEQARESEQERGHEEEQAREAGGKDCSTIAGLDAEPAKQPPEDVVVLLGAHVYKSEGPFGKTERFYATVDGEASELPTRRDDAARALEGVGFTTLSTDQEENTEAEAHLKGAKHTVDIQVVSLCQGKLQIRYTVS